MIKTMDSTALAKRRGELATDLAASEKALTAARRALVIGKSKAAAVIAAQAEFSALEAALRSLDQELEQATAAEQAERDRQHRAAIIGACATIANEGTATYQAYTAALHDAQQAIETAALSVFDAQQQHIAMRAWHVGSGR